MQVFTWLSSDPDVPAGRRGLAKIWYKGDFLPVSFYGEDDIDAAKIAETWWNDEQAKMQNGQKSSLKRMLPKSDAPAPSVQTPKKADPASAVPSSFHNLLD